MQIEYFLSNMDITGLDDHGRGKNTVKKLQIERQA